ncbi:hypothetical protein MMC24_003408 [Lignoscripta atroalba]|nr:hypothetical protein [Lignoscripta atroalba]
MSLEGPLDLTFGAELEFLLEYRPDLITDDMRAGTGWPDRTQWVIETAIQQQLCRALEAANIQVEGPRSLMDEDRNVQRWFVLDEGLEPPDEEERSPGCEYIGMEVNSRVLSATEENLSASLQEMRTALAVIKTFGYKVFATEGTGLHFHVGNRSKGFSLTTLKKISLVVYGFEHQIESIHPDRRLPLPSIEHTSQYCKSPSLSLYDKLNTNSGPIANLLAINECKTIPELIDLMQFSHHKYSAYNFLNLDARNLEILGPDGEVIQSGYKSIFFTLEFRQHKGTLDEDEICNWAEFVTGLVNWCHNVRLDVLLPLLVSNCTDSNFTVLDLMKFMGKEHLVDFYKDRLFHRERTPGMSDEEQKNEEETAPPAVVTRVLDWDKTETGREDVDW